MLKHDGDLIDLNFFGCITADVNGDGRADVMCVANDGGVAVWLSKEGNWDFYEFSSEWTDSMFGFCPEHDLKQVIVYSKLVQ